MELHFTRTNGSVDKTIDLLIKQAKGIHQPEIIREMILAALKAGQEDGEKADLRLMNATMKEMRFTTKVFSPYRDVKKVTVFGSARTKPEETLYAMARELGQKLVEA
ncbi:MAG: Rossman fold protein, TIGR00730 family, partial [Planctomycetota bacterium]